MPNKIYAIRKDSSSVFDDEKAIIMCKYKDIYGNTNIKLRNTICAEIDSGIKYVVDKAPNYPTVDTFEYDGEKYLRSRKNETEKDNLLSLEEF